MSVLSGCKKVDPSKLEPEVLLYAARMLTDDELEKVSDVSPALRARIAEKSAAEVFELYLNYIGIIGYTHTIIGVMGNIADAAR